MFGARLTNTGLVHSRPPVNEDSYRRFLGYKDYLEGTPKWPQSNAKAMAAAAGQGSRRSRSDVPIREKSGPLGGRQASDGTPLMSGHFLDELRATFAERAGRPALIYRDRTYTYGELDRRARRCAAWLQGLGRGEGGSGRAWPPRRSCRSSWPTSASSTRARSPCR